MLSAEERRSEKELFKNKRKKFKIFVNFMFPACLEIWLRIYFDYKLKREAERCRYSII